MLTEHQLLYRAGHGLIFLTLIIPRGYPSVAKVSDSNSLYIII